MQARDLTLFCAPGGGPPLTFAGDRAGEELLNGTLLADGAPIGRVVDGIASFTDSDNWTTEKLAWLKSEGWIPRNWMNEASHAAHCSARGALCQELAALDGAILEGAAGPGGGNMPPVLQQNPSARIIVNDLSPGVLQLWQGFLRPQGLGPQLCFAAFDASRMPIRSESVAALSGQACFSEVGGLAVFEETRRVLQPGGMAFSGEGMVDPEDWAQMPADRRAWWEARTPGMTVGAAGLLEQYGFEVTSREMVPGRALEADEGDLPRDAAKYGVTLHIVWEYVKARKR